MRQTKPKLTTVDYADRFEAETAASSGVFATRSKPGRAARPGPAGATAPAVAR